MSLWIFASLAAATFQTVRFMLQKVLATARLSAGGATFARFFYSAPVITAILIGYLAATGRALPSLPPAFWAYGMAGGAAQVIATICVVKLFKQRNFAVGVTFAKTEVMLTVLVGLVLLGEGVSPAGFLCIFVGLIGVLLLSDTADLSGPAWRRLVNPAAGLGLASGFLFSISAVAYRGASLQVEVAEPLLRAGVTLSAVTMMQMVGMAIWLRWRDPDEISRVWAARRTAGFIGLFSMAGSFGWFTAFTLQNAAYVKALGQVELILSLLASVLFFREKVSWRELIGMAVLAVSIVALVLVI